jgi:hypothetical protein
LKKANPRGPDFKIQRDKEIDFDLAHEIILWVTVAQRPIFLYCHAAAAGYFVAQRFHDIDNKVPILI